MQAHPTKTVHITGLPVAGINKVDKNEKTEAAMEKKFSSDLNDYMLDALNDYAGFIFKSLLGNDGKDFVQDLLKNKEKVFSASTEGGIFESALSLGSRNSGAFGGDDSARFDFEEKGHMSGTLRDSFFSDYNWITRADAKRTDTNENINSLISKSFGTRGTAQNMMQYPPLRKDISSWQKERKQEALD